VVALTLAGVAAPSPAAARLPARCSAWHWVGSWLDSPSDAGSFRDASLHTVRLGADQTFRMIITPHLGGSTVRLHLSNRFDTAPVRFATVTIADRKTGAAVATGTIRVVTFAGARAVTLAPGASVVSDPVRFTVRPFRDLAVSLFVYGADARPTEHFTARQTSYVTPPGAGDHAANASGLAFTQRTTARYYVTGLDALSSAREGAVVAFGDSITDGYQAPPTHVPEVQSTLNTNRRYPDDLQRRLDDAGIRLSVLNAGISGNRLLADGLIPPFGPSGLSRFESDALDQPGVTDVIVLEGINDIGLSRGITARALIDGYRRLVAAAHRAGVSIQLGTLTPSGTSSEPGYSGANADALRAAVNAWIRSQRISNGIVDFDAAVRDPRRPDDIAPAYDGGDGLHFNPAGYRALANAVPLSKLARPRCGRCSGCNPQPDTY
jgi:lysophospholipase L1-like esterase